MVDTGAVGAPAHETHHTEDAMLPPHSMALLDSRVGFHIEGRGRPVVLLHSSMASKGQWRELVERMRRSHRLIAARGPVPRKPVIHPDTPLRGP